MKYLIVGLGNVGTEYHNTRHNIGFMILDAFTEASNLVFSDQRYGATCQLNVKNKTLILLKPSTFMNLSGKAIRYWMTKENIPIENLLVLVDDISLPMGKLRLKKGGSDAGHNGLKSIQELLQTNKYARLRFGIGNEYLKGSQIEYVLGTFTREQQKLLPERIKITIELIKTFCLAGINNAMNQFNNK